MSRRTFAKGCPACLAFPEIRCFLRPVPRERCGNTFRRKMRAFLIAEQLSLSWHPGKVIAFCYPWLPL
jgi:hypothetical protein